MKKILSVLMALIMALSAVQCLSVVSFAVGEENSETEPNNNRSNANLVLSFDEAYTGRLDNNSDVDWYKFKIDKSDCCFSVLLEENPTNANPIKQGWKISIFKEDGKTLLKQGTSPFQSSNLTYQGTVYVKVEANDNSETNVPTDCYYNLVVTANSSHSYIDTTITASTAKDGKTVTACEICGKVIKTVPIYKASSIKLSTTSFTYNGKVKTPSVTVKNSKGKTLKNGQDYTVTYATGRKKPGRYFVKVVFKGDYSGSKTLYFNILPSKTSKLSATQTLNSVKVSWKSVTGASGYKIVLTNKNNGAERKVYTTKTTHTFEKIPKSTLYKINVIAYKTINGKKVLSDVSTQLTTATRPDKPKLQAVAGKNKAFLFCTEKYASGYEFYMKSGNSYKKIATVKSNYGSYEETGFFFDGAASVYINGVQVDISSNTEQYDKTGLKSGATYYFKARAYKLADGKKVYGAFSDVKSVKVK